MGDEGTSSRAKERYPSPDDLPPHTKRARKTSWEPPELVALALLATGAFYAVGSIVTNVGELDNPPLDGWRTTLAFWTAWATEPWFPVLLLLASLVAWHAANTWRDSLFEAGDFEDTRTEEAESDRAYAPTDEAWDREKRALVIAGVAAVLGALSCLAVVLLVIDNELPGARSAFLGVVPNLPGSALTWSRVAVVLNGLAVFVPALATVVVFRHVRRIWMDPKYSDDSIDSTLSAQS